MHQGMPGAVPGHHIFGVAVGNRIELRQLQCQLQVQARVVGEACLRSTKAINKGQQSGLMSSRCIIPWQCQGCWQSVVGSYMTRGKHRHDQHKQDNTVALSKLKVFSA